MNSYNTARGSQPKTPRNARRFWYECFDFPKGRSFPRDNPFCEAELPRGTAALPFILYTTAGIRPGFHTILYIKNTPYYGVFLIMGLQV